LETQFKNWAEKETKDIGKALEAVAEKTVALIKEDANKASTQLYAYFNNTCMPNFKINVDTFGYDFLVYTGLSIGTIALYVGSLYFAGFMLAAAVPALAYLAKNRTDSEYKRLCLEKLPGLIRSSADKIGPKLDEMIDDFANKLDQFIKEASEDLHKELLDVLKSVKQLRSGTEEEIENQKKDVVELGAKVTLVDGELKRLKSSLV
jgi:gas vesicle protein